MKIYHKIKFIKLLKECIASITREGYMATGR